MARTKHTYITKTGATQFKASLRWAKGVVHGDNSEGFCLACGETQGCVEPDARKYTCESCGAPKVYGAEQLLIMNLVY